MQKENHKATYRDSLIFKLSFYNTHSKHKPINK